MNEKTKPQRHEAQKPAEEKPEFGDEASWSREQREKSYYYDDDCGYEIYNPGDDDDEEENDEDEN